jgi:hypothetical protein
MSGPHGRSDVAAQLHRIRTLHTELAQSRTEYDLQAPALVSHADTYASDLPRLRRYATTTVNARIMQLLAVTFMKTYHFLDAYLYGIDKRNPFAALGAARSQLEIYAVTWDTVEAVRRNSGGHTAGFAERVKAVDEALISATYGTRSPLLKDLMRQSPGISKVRPVNDEDVALIDARNVLGRIDRLAKSNVFPDSRDLYDRLCEYLHPNVGQNLILCTPSGLGENFWRLERSGDLAIQYALTASAFGMAQSAEGSVRLFDGLTPPFGNGPKLTVPRSSR